MQELLDQFGPYMVSGLVSAVASWAIIRAEVTFLRRDVDGLRERVHGPRNPNNIISVQQAHATRLTVIETKMGINE